MRRKQLRDWRSRPRCKIDLRRGCPRGPEKAVIDRRLLSYLRGVCRRLNYAVILRRTGWLPFRAFVLFPSFLHSFKPTTLRTLLAFLSTMSSSSFSSFSHADVEQKETVDKTSQRNETKINLV